MVQCSSVQWSLLSCSVMLGSSGRVQCSFFLFLYNLVLSAHSSANHRTSLVLTSVVSVSISGVPGAFPSTCSQLTNIFLKIVFFIPSGHLVSLKPLCGKPQSDSYERYRLFEGMLPLLQSKLTTTKNYGTPYLVQQVSFSVLDIFIKTFPI